MVPMRRSGAHFSPCGIWRYTLWRKWDGSKGMVAFIGLNPSTATEIANDPTVRRCIGFAHDWGYGGMWMLNIFGLRSTDPKALYIAEEPIGAENDYWIKEIVPRASLTVCAWGNHGAYLERGDSVINLLRDYELHHLGKTKNGNPRHPLYLRKDLKPMRLEL